MNRDSKQKLQPRTGQWPAKAGTGSSRSPVVDATFDNVRTCLDRACFARHTERRQDKSKYCDRGNLPLLSERYRVLKSDEHRHFGWAAIVCGGCRTADTRQRESLQNSCREPGKAQTVIGTPLNFVNVNPLKGSL